MLLDKGAKNFVFHGAGTNLGRIFLRIAKRKGLEGIAITKTQEEADSLKKEYDLKNVFCHDDKESFWKPYLEIVESMRPEFFLDCCGSDWSGRLFACMPKNS
jgi:NADPH:quinone reductase-like Zn-dependent oxidoreductase